MTGSLPSSPASPLRAVLFLASLLCLPLAGRCDPSLYGVELVGAASYCTVTLMQQLSLGYHLTNPLFSLTVVESSSQAAIDSFLAATADFAMVSSTMSSQEVTVYPNAIQLPFVALPIALTYNLPAVPGLTLSGTTLAHIYLGDISWWNDSAIQADNPAAALPNATIHVIIQTGGYMTNFVLLTALGQYYPPILSAIPPSLYPTFPTSRYASFSVADQLDGASALTLLYPHSIGYSVYSMALQSATQLAALYNTAGVPISISDLNIQLAVDYNSVLQVQLYPNAATSPDVVLSLESVSSVAWPLVGLQYVLVDAAYARSTCTAKAMMADFLLWVYQSDAATVTLDANGVLLLPSVVQSAIGIVSRLQGGVKCRGAPVIAVDTSTSVDVSSDSRMSALSSLLTAEFNFARSSLLLVDGTSYTLTSQSAQSSLVVDQMRFDEVDVGLFFADDIDPALLSHLLTSAQYTIAPLFLVVTAMVFNPQIHPAINLGSTPINLTLPVAVAVFGGVINDWTHPYILALNPYLASLFAALPPPVSAPLTVVVPCVVGSVGAYASKVLRRFVGNYPLVSLGTNLCAISAYPGNATSRRFVASESVLSAAVQVTVGGFGYSQIKSFDPTGVATLLVNSQLVGATPDSLLACVEDIDPTTLLINVQAATNPACNPFTQVAYAILPRQYTDAGHNCQVGSFAYKLFASMWNDSDKDAVFEAHAFVRAARNPAIFGLINATLPLVTCGSTPLLVATPTQWSLSTSVSAFAEAFAAIGLGLCVAFAAVLVWKRKHAAVQVSGGVWGMGVVLVGVALCLLTVFAWVQQPVSDVSCGLVLWGLNVSPSLMLGPLYARVYRWYRMYGIGHKMHRVNPLYVHLATLTPVVLSIVFVGVWTGLTPFISQTTGRYVGSQPWAYQQCGFAPSDSSTTSAFLVVAGFVQGGQLVVFSLLAFSVRRLMVSYNENARVAYALYNACFALLLLIPIMEVVGAIGDLLVLLVSLLLLWVAFAPLLLLFAPLTLHVFARSSTVPLHPALSSAHSMSLGFSFLAIGAMTEEVLKDYITALEGQLEDVRKRVNDAGGREGGGQEDRSELDKMTAGGNRKSSVSESGSAPPGRGSPAPSTQRSGVRNTGLGPSSRANSVARH